jgi:hypothetical protein
MDDFNLTGRIWHRKIEVKVAGRTVYRGRMGQTRYPELGRSTQLPHRRATRQEQKNLSIEIYILRIDTLMAEIM